MKAIITTRYGGTEVLQAGELPKPVIKANQILVNVKASSVNSGDVRVRSLGVRGFARFAMRLAMGWTRPRNPVLGTVFAGTVAEIGPDVKSFKLGDEVFGMTGMKMGAHAEYLAVPENSAVWFMPQGASFEEAAALVFGGTTALYFLDKAPMGPGEKVLVYGASGAVGTSVVQIAAARGAAVTAMASERNFSLLRSLGAQACLDYHATPLQQLEGSYDLVFEAVGIHPKAVSKHLLAPSGRYLAVGPMTEMAKESREQLQALKTLFEAGKLKPVIDRSYTWDEIREAHAYVDSGRKRGNVTITMP